MTFLIVIISFLAIYQYWNRNNNRRIYRSENFFNRNNNNFKQ